MKKKTVTSETEEITIDNKRQKRKREKKAYRVRKAQILVRQLFQKINAAHSIRQHVEHFQINPVFIISHAEHITVVLILLDIAAWKIALLAYFRRRFSILLKIIPEHPHAEP